MPVLTEYRHGMTMGIPPGRNDHMRAKRDDVNGWSDSSTRRNTRFLYSVDERKLTGHGIALSLTVRDCPDQAEHWQKVRKAFFMRLSRKGMIRAHWLTEWQRRGVPHLHAAIWLPDHSDGPPQYWCIEIKAAWLQVAEQFFPGSHSQHVVPICDEIGWFQYLSKHAVRGLGHYQRSAENIPAGWVKTGRMWGHLGDWPTIDPVRYTLDNSTFWAFRRMVQRWRLASARASGDRHRLRSARRMLQSPDRSAGSVRGVGEWVGTDQTQAFLRHLAALGHRISC